MEHRYALTSAWTGCSPYVEGMFKTFREAQAAQSRLVDHYSNLGAVKTVSHPNFLRATWPDGDETYVAIQKVRI